MRTRGQPYAEAAVRAIVAGGLHAVLLVGPPSVGKATLALDLAALLMCSAEADRRPCGECRGCHLVASGNHPDIHRLRPEGPGGQVRIEQVRSLATELSLLPVEAGARVAIVEAAHRLNEDAQNALLKTLEEPPSGVTIVLCADDEERLLPTVRSRCARIRLGPVSTREIEALLDDLALADPPRAARLARLAGGRPGLAVAYASAHDAALARGEIARGLLDLASTGPAARLVTIRQLHARAMSAATALASSDADPGSGTVQRPRGRLRPSSAPAVAASDGEVEDADADAAGGRKTSAFERRRGAAWLIDVWREVARDLSVLEIGQRRAVRDVESLEELEAVAGRLPPGAATSFLGALERAGERLDANGSPELLLDVLALRWPRVA